MNKLVKACVLLCLLIPVLGLFPNSQGELQYEKTSKNEWLFKQKTYDEVWSAAVKALMQLKYQVASSDKQGGIISAQKARSLLTRNADQGQLESFQIFVEQTDAGVKVGCQFTKKAGSMFQSDRSKYLLAKVADNLYGKAENMK